MERALCYSVYMSTTAAGALAAGNSGHYRLRQWDGDAPEIVGLLAYPARWELLGRHGGCSCHFRHLVEQNIGHLGFGPPVDWFPEDEDDLEATRAVYDLLSRLLETGNQVDLIDVWSDPSPDNIHSVAVSLREAGRDSFSFWENRRMDLKP